jgi:hypothetical protein
VSVNGRGVAGPAGAASVVALNVIEERFASTAAGRDGRVVADPTSLDLRLRPAAAVVTDPGQDQPSCRAADRAPRIVMACVRSRRESNVYCQPRVRPCRPVT